MNKSIIHSAEPFFFILFVMVRLGSCLKTSPETASNQQTVNDPLQAVVLVDANEIKSDSAHSINNSLYNGQ
jgi:hypothetical protein